MSHLFIPGIASQSLGCPQQHSIKEKLEAAASVGLRSVEIFFEDIRQLARRQHNDPDDQAAQLSAAHQIGQWCRTLPIEIICLQPFMHFEGLLNPAERESRFEKLKFWIQVAKALGTDLIQIPSNFLPASECTGDFDRIVADMRHATEIGTKHGIRFAHEALCWGTHTDTWDAAWRIVEAVDMNNFGTCIDTFNLCGRVYADPEAESGKMQNADEDLRKSVQLLKETFADPEKLKKVFYVELCDGERLEKTLDESHEWFDKSQPSRMTWSRSARLYPFENDVEEAREQGRGPGYLPITEVFDTLLNVGYQGHLSFEVFNRTLNEPGQDVIAKHAQRAGESWRRCASYIDEYFRHKSEALENLEEEETEDNASFTETEVSSLPVSRIRSHHSSRELTPRL